MTEPTTSTTTTPTAPTTPSAPKEKPEIPEIPEYHKRHHGSAAGIPSIYAETQMPAGETSSVFSKAIDFTSPEKTSVTEDVVEEYTPEGDADRTDKRIIVLALDHSGILDNNYYFFYFFVLLYLFYIVKYYTHSFKILHFFVKIPFFSFHL